MIALTDQQGACNDAKLGNLSFEEIVKRNIALLGKWLWRFPREGPAL